VSFAIFVLLKAFVEWRITCFFRLLLDAGASIKLNIGDCFERNCRLDDPGRASCSIKLTRIGVSTQVFLHDE
jgi:hypothetical protein